MTLFVVSTAVSKRIVMEYPMYNIFTPYYRAPVSFLQYAPAKTQRENTSFAINKKKKKTKHIRIYNRVMTI